MGKILEGNSPPRFAHSGYLWVVGLLLIPIFFGFSISQALYNKDVSFSKSKDFNETYFYMSPSWGVLGSCSKPQATLKARKWKAKSSPAQKAACTPRSGSLGPGCLMALPGPGRILREQWHWPPAPAGTAASAVGSRPGRGRQETEARLTAEEAVLQVNRPLAFGDGMGDPGFWGML